MNKHFNSKFRPVNFGLYVGLQYKRELIEMIRNLCLDPELGKLKA